MNFLKVDLIRVTVRVRVKNLMETMNILQSSQGGVNNRLNILPRCFPKSDIRYDKKNIYKDDHNLCDDLEPRFIDTLTFLKSNGNFVLYIFYLKYSSMRKCLLAVKSNLLCHSCCNVCAVKVVSSSSYCNYLCYERSETQ